jgi:hypothetical protein
MSTTTELDLFLMSNLSPKKTGLPFVVWISPRGNTRHDLRVKVSRSPSAMPEEFVTVAVREIRSAGGAVRPEIRIAGGAYLPTSDFNLLKRWIELNQEALVRFWNGDIEYTEDVLEELKSL